jgi:hypothetical protein
MSQKRPHKKLTLERETLRRLTDTELAPVAGGANTTNVPTFSACSCPNLSCPGGCPK